MVHGCRNSRNALLKLNNINIVREIDTTDERRNKLKNQRRKKEH